MKVVRSLAELPAISASVATVGNFDGVHLGHAAIFERVREEASKSRAQSVAITFDPHPLVQIAPSRAPVPISTLDQRIALIEAQGIDVLLVQDFSEPFSQLSPQEFIRDYLLEALNVRTLCVGSNFRFGHQHQGSIDTLRSCENRFDVVEVPPVFHRGALVSSSRIRELLLEGHVSAARHLLGRCYEIEGSIVSGRGRGREVTVPTLNLDPRNRLIPRDGVYLTVTATESGDLLDSVTNVGVRPTFQERERTIETHVLNRQPGIANGHLRLRFLHRLRDEQRFADVHALRSQIERDLQRARRFFSRLATQGCPRETS